MSRVNKCVVLSAVFALIYGILAIRAAEPKIDAKSNGPVSANRPLTAATWGIKVRESTLRATRIELVPRRGAFFLGENILVDYKVINDGDSELNFSGASNPRFESCQVVAADVDGKQVLESTMDAGGGSVSCGVAIGHGQSAKVTIPLTRYCRFIAPGTYRIHVALDLGWSEEEHRPPKFLDNDPRWASATIVLKMPTAAEAEDIVKHMCNAKRLGANREFGRFWGLPDYSDFTCLQYPIYIPLLERLLRERQHEDDAIIGIAHIPTVEATEALVRQLTAEPKLAFKAAAAINDRLPPPYLKKYSDRVNPIALVDADRALVAGCWRQDFALSVRKYAKELLTKDNLTGVRCAAFQLQSIGTAEDVPLLVRKLDSLIVVCDREVPPKSFIEAAGRSPSWECCDDLRHAIVSISSSNSQALLNPSSAGELVSYLTMIADVPKFRPEGWASRWTECLKNESRYVRDVAVLAEADDVPARLKNDLVEATQKTIATTADAFILHRAVHVALKRGIPRDKIAKLLLERLQSKALYQHVYLCLLDIIKTGEHDSLDFACILTPDIKQIMIGQAVWNRFLEKHGAELRNGKHFSIGSLDGSSEMLLPDTN